MPATVRPPPAAEAISMNEPARLAARAYRRFYLRPAFIRRIVVRLMRPRMFLAVMRSAYRLITERPIY
jgi:hypothetical protein